MATLDHSAFPHILQRVIELSDFESLQKLRTVSASVREHVERRLFRHVQLQRDLRNPADVQIATRTERTRLARIPQKPDDPTWVSYARVLKYVEILDIFDPGPPSVLAKALELAVIDVEKPRPIVIRAFAPSVNILTTPGLDMHVCAIGRAALARPPRICRRFSQVGRDLAGSYALTYAANVLHVNTDEPLHNGDWIRRDVIRYMDSPRFSLTVVLREPDVDDRFLQQVCGVQYDPAAMEQVEMLKQLPNVHITDLKTYIEEHPAEVILETNMSFEQLLESTKPRVSTDEESSRASAETR